MFKRELLSQLDRMEKEKQNTLPRENYLILTFAEKTFSKLLSEGLIEEDTNLYHSLNRTSQWLITKDCGILTAWRSKNSRKQNNEANKELLDLLQKENYGVIKIAGCYAEVGCDTSKERSFLVFPIDQDTETFKNTLFKLSCKFDQDCFLFKEAGLFTQAYLIGTNEDFGLNRVECVGELHINSEKACSYSEVGSGRISFEFTNI